MFRHLVFELGSVALAVALRWALPGRIPGLEACWRMRMADDFAAKYSSRSDRARSSFMIAALSHFSGRFFGLRVRRIARRVPRRTIASIARRVADKVDELLNMYAGTLHRFDIALFHSKLIPQTSHERI